MDILLKPIERQVIVITGASSGIGLATALAAAERGAALVLAARSEATLERIARAINDFGGRAVAVRADVGVRAEVAQIAAAAIAQFGRIDTWVNNAGVTLYGRLDEVDDADHRRLFDTNYWGVVHGSLAALPYLKRQGGALVNVGSEGSDAVLPLQGSYAASKHAVKGFTDALRDEVAADGAAVSVTLVQPGAVDTPLAEHAGNYLGRPPQRFGPMLTPQAVADAILAAAARPVRHTRLAAVSHLDAAFARIAPSIAESAALLQVDRRPAGAPVRHGALYAAGESGRVHGRSPGEPEGSGG